MSLTILTGDCREVLKTLPDESVNCVVTSPPYWGLRDYGVAGQIGQESSPDAFVAELVAVFREVRRVLKSDGTLWLNMGDCYARAPEKGGSGPGGKNENRWGYGVAQSAKVGSSDGYVARGARPGTRATAQELKPKDLVGQPWRLAFALQADGWWLRQDIIWHKPNPMPESVSDRCTKAHEYLFLLTKSERNYYDQAAISEPANGWNGSKFHIGKTFEHQLRRASVKRGDFDGKTNQLEGREAFRAVTETRNKRSVWTVPTKAYGGAHFATFPPDLIRPCILAGCPQGGTVLDPFGGSGTTGEVAEMEGRKAILIELNPEYVKLAEKRTAQAGLFTQASEVAI